MGTNHKIPPNGLCGHLPKALWFEQSSTQLVFQKCDPQHSGRDQSKTLKNVKLSTKRRWRPRHKPRTMVGCNDDGFSIICLCCASQRVLYLLACIKAVARFIRRKYEHREFAPHGRHILSP